MGRRRIEYWKWLAGMFFLFSYCAKSRWTLLCPVIFHNIGEKTLYIFAVFNVITIPMVWALYPESNQRTLEEMDLLFAAETPWVWDAEKKFARLKEEHPEIAQATHSRKTSQNLKTENTGEVDEV
jgi:hypothetical protein